MYFVCFLDIRSCQRKQTRDMQRIQNSSKTTSKINELEVQLENVSERKKNSIGEDSDESQTAEQTIKDAVTAAGESEISPDTLGAMDDFMRREARVISA